MSYFVSPEFFRVLLLGLITSLQMTWRRLLNQAMPLPYLDEVFHIPQAQAYWAGQWTYWDPKITTPPGLYLFSYLASLVRNLAKLDFTLTPNELRISNTLLFYFLLVALYVSAAVGRRRVGVDGVFQREFGIVLFPLIFFFSGLYYTDLFSVFTVLLTQIFWSAGSTAEGSKRILFQFLHVAIGLVSLAARQTNVFWVAIYLGGLQLVDTVKHETGADKIHDPAVSEAFFEDSVITSISLAQASLPLIPKLLRDLWPQLCLLCSFAGFVFWNGGVVLGDKTNHVATIHLPQMLYIWPAMVFFSWPTMLPLLSDLSVLRRRIPRPSTTLAFLVLMLAVVHVNTIIHPFTLADNRHYTFYVFRLLRKHWLVKYAAVPVYYLCACLVLGALGGATDVTAPSDSVRILYGDDTVCMSFMLVWLVSTALSLVAAPLVEPRYFLVPWLMWRLAVPEYLPPTHPQRQPLVVENGSKGKPKNKVTSSDPTPATEKALAPAAAATAATADLQSTLRNLAAHSNALEMFWNVLVNLGTCYMFLYRGFEWPQEPGNVQRFMW